MPKLFLRPSAAAKYLICWQIALSACPEILPDYLRNLVDLTFAEYTAHTEAASWRTPSPGREREHNTKGIGPLQDLRSCRRLFFSLLIATGIALLVGCQGLASGGSGSNGGGSTLAASSSTLSFGNVQNSKSANLSETLTNTGGSVVTISGAKVSGTGFSASGLSMPMTLSPKQSVTFTVTFAPTATGSASGTLAVVSTADNPTLSIALSGTGTAQGQLSVAPTSLSFGSVVVGTSGSLNGTLGATGSSVTISAANINSSEFALSAISLPTTLTAGQTTSFTVTFQPATSGTASATLSFSSDAANSPAAQALTGSGTAPTQHSVALNWNASTGPGVVGYNVFRGSVSGGPYSQINSALEASTAYTDNSVAAGQTYYYVVTAVDGSDNQSGYSNPAQAVIPTP